MPWRRMRAVGPPLCPVAAAAIATALLSSGAPPAEGAITDIRTVRTQAFGTGMTTLTPAAVVPPAASAASGVAELSFGGAPGLLWVHYEITHNVVGETSAHIHRAFSGANGPIVHTLPLGSPKIGDWPITASELSRIAQEEYYIDIHSMAFAGGEIRGQMRVQNFNCFGPPVEGRPVCLKVVVQNLGPDPYVGTGPALGVRNALPLPAAAGRLRVTVDIDEPTKPRLGPPRTAFTISNDFAVTIAPGDSATLDFGEVPYTPPSGGLFGATTTSEAQAPNVDPNPANNTVTTPFTVTATTPALGLGLAVLAAAALSAIAFAALRRAKPPGPSTAGSAPPQ